MKITYGENEEMDKKINALKSSIHFFKKKFINKKYKFYTTHEKEYIVTFDPSTYLNLTCLKDVIKCKNKSIEKKLNNIFGMLIKGELDVNKNAFEKAIMNTSYISSLVNFDINHVHSFIEIDDKSYVLIKNNTSNIVVKVEKKSEEDDLIHFKVKSVCNPKILNRELLMSEVEVDLPYKIEIIKYVDDKMEKHTSKISKKVYEKRKDLFREYIYFDKDGNDRDENSIFEVKEFVERVPIIKK